MSSFGAIDIAGSGLVTHRKWLDAISDNVANINDATSTDKSAFQARMVQAQAVDYGSGTGGVEVTGVTFGSAQGRLVHEPDNPLADKDGNVLCSVASPCTAAPPANWYYKRVWQVSTPSANLKQITVTATVAATDEQRDLALLNVRGNAGPPLTFRSGPEMRRGEGVVTYGFPLAGLLSSGPTLTTGEVSALAGLHGAWGVRVHDVQASVDALRVLDAWTQSEVVGSDG